MNGKAASDKIFTLLDTPVETQQSAVDFEAKNNVQVEIKDLHFAYSAEKPAIQGLTLTIQPTNFLYLWVKVVAVNQPWFRC